MASSDSVTPRLVLGFPDYAEPAHRLAAAADIPCQIVDLHRFPDGESRVRIPLPIPQHVIFCRTLDRPNDKLIELFLAGSTARQLGTTRVSLVAPYLCYMRQDVAFNSGESVSARVVGKLLADLFDDVITVDPHLHRVHHLRDAVPASQVEVVTAAKEMGAFLAGHMEAPVVLGPDAESEQWVRQIADPHGFDFAVGNKVRLDDRHVTFSLPEFDFRDRQVVLVDDVASTGCTVISAANELSKHRPALMAAFVTHALFVDDAVNGIKAAGVRRVWSTDTIVHESNVVQLAAPIATALRGI